MPHVVVKMYSGRSEEQKRKLAEAVTNAVMAITGNGEDSISVRIEDVAASDWTEKVYKPDIENGAGKLYKRPGYGPLASSEP
jgi:4-oxalocrotonate tautomerase